MVWRIVSLWWIPLRVSNCLLFMPSDLICLTQRPLSKNIHYLCKSSKHGIQYSIEQPIRWHLVNELSSDRDPENLHKLQEWAVLLVMMRAIVPLICRKYFENVVIQNIGVSTTPSLLLHSLASQHNCVTVSVVYGVPPNFWFKVIEQQTDLLRSFDMREYIYHLNVSVFDRKRTVVVNRSHWQNFGRSEGGSIEFLRFTGKVEEIWRRRFVSFA